MRRQVFGAMGRWGVLLAIPLLVMGLKPVRMSGDAEDGVPIPEAVPTITKHPESQVKCIGESAILNVEALGWPLSYRWKKGETPLVDDSRIAGATTSVLTITNLGIDDAADYRCAVTSGVWSVDSNPGTLLVHEITRITQSPAGTVVCGGTALSLTVTASGGSLTYQWQRDEVDLTETERITGVQSDSLWLSPVRGEDAGTYRCLVDGACGSATSDDAVIAVRAGTLVTRQPVSRAVCSGHTARMMVAATGADLTYQWAKDGVPLNDDGHVTGSSSPLLTIYQTGSGDQGTYTCRISGPCGTVDSQIAELTLVDSPCSTEAPRPFWEATDVNAGGDTSYAGELTVVTSTGQGGGVGDLAGGPYGTRDGFLAAAAPAMPVVIVPSDFDEDGDVDEEDFDHLASCWTGPALGPPATGCENADLDGDGDIDQADFGLLQRCLSGVGAPSDPACVP